MHVLSAGDRSVHDVVDQFYIKLTPVSLQATVEVERQVVAGNWQMGGDKAVRIRKRRKVFRCAARAVGKHLLRAKQGKQTPVRKAAAPAKHHLKPGKMIDPTPGNFTRSKKGEALIKQEAAKLLQLDASLFPKKPAFDKISGECRLTQSGFV